MTALNLTAADAAALAFYEENLSYVEGFGLANLDREDRLQFRQGKKVLDLLAKQTKVEIGRAHV